MRKLIVLVGESASGKSSIEKELIDFGYNPIISYTTRPAREGEVDGVDYHFITDKEFNSMKEKGEFAEVGKYNDGFYGTVKTDYLKSTSNDVCDKVVVLTPHGLRQIKKIYKSDIVSFHIKVPRRDRLVKMLQRGDNIEECFRRSTSDVGQFDGIEDDVDFVIDNDKYKLSPCHIALDIIELLIIHANQY